MTALDDAPTPLPFHLKGNYAPIFDEVTITDLQVTGSIPKELSGRYLRNGSNPQSGTAEHWFFGDGMVHGIRLADGKAEWYRNRYVRTTQLEKGLEATDPESMFDPTASAANTHVVGHAGRIWALEEGHFPYELSPELETLGCSDFGGKLTTAFTAHPKICAETGEMHFFGYSPLPPYLTYHVLDAKGDLVHSEPIAVPQGTMMHDFMITREHAIFMDLPVVFDLDNLASGVPLKWDENYGARIGIVPRMGRDTETKWFEVDPCYVFHPMNSYVEGNTVVADVGRHESMWRTSMDDFEPCYLYRWTFNLDTGAVTETQLDDRAHAFPRVDERLVGLKHRYGWVAAARDIEGDFGEPGVVTKYDVENGTTETHDFGAHGFPGEFVFVPASDAAAEDEGWAIGLVYDRTTGTSDLVILDGRTPSAPPVATVHLPRRIPFGFHGSWVDDRIL